MEVKSWSSQNKMSLLSNDCHVEQKPKQPAYVSYLHKNLQSHRRNLLGSHWLWRLPLTEDTDTAGLLLTDKSLKDVIASQKSY